jgi:hypothetical protein
MGGSSSVAERQLPKLNVAGSIPVSRSNGFSYYDERRNSRIRCPPSRDGAGFLLVLFIRPRHCFIQSLGCLAWAERTLDFQSNATH